MKAGVRRSSMSVESSARLRDLCGNLRNPRLHSERTRRPPRYEFAAVLHHRLTVSHEAAEDLVADQHPALRDAVAIALLDDQPQADQVIPFALKTRVGIESVPPEE